jgi:hypothetical protein
MPAKCAWIECGESGFDTAAFVRNSLIGMEIVL